MIRKIIKSSHGLAPRIMKLRKGFTLVEIMVSLTIFSVLIVLATSSFVRALRTERQIAAFIAVNSNVGAFLEQIAREMRTGKDFCINGNNCSATSIAFTNADGEKISYCLDDNSIKRSANSSCSSGQSMTGANVLVEYLSFVVSGNRDNDNLPPRITILVGATSNKQYAVSYEVNLQTTVSARLSGG